LLKISKILQGTRCSIRGPILYRLWEKWRYWQDTQKSRIPPVFNTLVDGTAGGNL